MLISDVAVGARHLGSGEVRILFDPFLAIDFITDLPYCHVLRQMVIGFGKALLVTLDAVALHTRRVNWLRHDIGHAMNCLE